jgi:hypothetical protein
MCTTPPNETHKGSFSRNSRGGENVSNWDPEIVGIKLKSVTHSFSINPTFIVSPAQMRGIIFKLLEFIS